MGKPKKKHIADQVRTKKGKDPARRQNPFEVKINRQKHNVIGKKLTKFDKGMPGVSRSRAIEKRKATLLQEYKRRNKSNKLIDKRFGENDPDMDPEEKMLKRFALEKRKTHEKPGIFSLNETDDLTHYGQSLAEIEKFEDPVDSDSDDEGIGKIDAKMVAEEHFGGFMTKKNEEEEGGRTKSWKERMEEVITKSKKEKYERQHQKEKDQELTNQLDAQWKELTQTLKLTKKDGTTGDDDVLPKSDDYDMAVRSLRFEMRGQATDKLKTEEELAQDEKKRLEKLEADRTRRMKGIMEGDVASQFGMQPHRSADDLDDDFDCGTKSKDFVVQYKDGKLVDQESDKESGSEDDDDEEESDDDDKGDEEESDDVKEEEEGSEEESEEEDEEEKQPAKKKSVKFSNVKTPKDDDSNEDSNNDDDDDDDDSGSDDDDPMGRTSDLESDEDEEEEEKSGSTDKKMKKLTSILKKAAIDPEKLKESLMQRKEMMEAAKEELPYTFKAPETYDDLLELLEGHSNSDQITIISRVRKCHHPSLAEGNKDRLNVLFGLLLEYYGDLAVQDPPEVHLMSKLVKHLYELCQQNPTSTAITVVNVLKLKQQEFTEYAETHKGRHLYPGLDVLMFFKLISILFPASDFKHPVITPTMLFMGQILSECQITTRRDIASGLFLCTTLLEYVSFSKRFVPEVINFLCGLLFLASEKDPKIIEPVLPPFKPIGRNINFLEVKKDSSKKIDVQPVKISDVFAKSKSPHLATEEFRVHCVYQCLHLLRSYAKLYEDLPSYTEIFNPVSHFLKKLPSKLYPQKLQSLIKEVQGLATAKKTRSCLIMHKKKPVPMKLYEPAFQEVFDGKKKRTVKGDKAEKQRLEHKYKKEMKSAKREIKKDMQFIAREKLNEQMKKDSDRKRKVREIMGQLADQEGDYKKLKREKDKLDK